jgi:hypothetical protein
VNPGDTRASGPGPSAPPAAAKAGTDEKKGYWQSASPAKKASLVMAPLALGLAYWMLQDPPPPPPPKILTAASHKAADPHGAPGAGALSVAGSAGSVSAPPPSAGASAHDPPSAGVGANAGGSTNDGGSTNAAASAVGATRSDPAAGGAASSAAAKKAPTLPPGKRTADRQALDAVASGSIDDAVRQYGDLANAHADVPAYQEAARILREKASRAR